MCYTIQDAIAELQEEVFKRLQNEHEGEMDEDQLHEMVHDDNMMHEECDDFVAELYPDELMDILAEYGFQEAIQLRIDKYGSFQTAPTCAALVYTIIYNKTYKHITLFAYKDYCEQNPL